jgi:hypothetical protein
MNPLSYDISTILNINIIKFPNSGMPALKVELTPFTSHDKYCSETTGRISLGLKKKMFQCTISSGFPNSMNTIYYDFQNYDFAFHKRLRLSYCLYASSSKKKEL